MKMVLNNKSYLLLFLLIAQVLFANRWNPLNDSLKIARSLERVGKIDKAIETYKNILKKDENNSQAFQRLSKIFIDYKLYDQGIQFYRSSILNNSKNPKNFVELGQILFFNNQNNEASITWRTGLKKFKHKRAYYRDLLNVFSRNSLDEELILLLQTGKNLFGNSFLSYESGIHYQARGIYDKAMDQFILHLINEPQKNGVIERRIMLMSDEESALDIIETKLIEASEKNPSHTLDVLSEFYFKRRDFQKSFEIKKTLSSHTKTDYDRWLKFANDLRKESEYQLSINAYNYIIENKVKPRIASKALMGLAKAFEDQILPSNHYHLIPYFFDNNIFFEDLFGLQSSISFENLQSSIDIYDSLLVMAKNSPLIAETYYRLGNIQYRVMQDFDKSYFLLNKALKHQPNKILQIKIILRISDTLLAMGKTEEAISFLEEQNKKYREPSIDQRIILVSFISRVPESTMAIVDTLFFSIDPLNPFFNDLMELKTLLTKYYTEDKDDKSAFYHFQKSEFYMRQNKIGSAIKELEHIISQYQNAKILPLITLRISLLYYRMKDYNKSINFAQALNDTELHERGLILSGQIHEVILLDSKKALEYYMQILNDFPNSIYTEPIRYHIRELNSL